MTESTLAVTYATLRSEIGYYLGWTRTSTNWSATQEAIINECLADGLRRFYYPLPLPADDTEGQLQPHKWSFLRKTATLSITSATADYNLPDDFGALKEGFTLEGGSNAQALSEVDEGYIRQLRAGAQASGTPTVFAIRAKAKETTAGTRHEVLFYPTPNATATYSYAYDVIPNTLESSDTYPLGGALHGQTILAACLAAAELKAEDAEAVHGASFQTRLRASIAADRAAIMRATDTTSWPATDPDSAALAVTYAGLMREVGAYLGFGYDMAAWTHVQKQRADDIVQKGLRQFYYPPAIGKEAISHEWSFLAPLATLSITSASYKVDLPADFDGMAVNQFLFASGVGNKPVALVSESKITALRADSSRSGAPEYAAIIPKTFSATTGQRYEVAFFPTPNTTYTLHYRYRITPGRLTATNKYPLGGTAHSESILAACLSAAELADKRQPGPMREAFMERLVSSVRMDQEVAKQTTALAWPSAVTADTEVGYTYSKLMRAAALYLGFEADDALWTNEQKNELNEIVQDGYGRFLMPPGGHKWSFLSPTGMLQTTSGTYAYDLPTGFASITGSLTFDPDEAWPPREIQIVGENKIRELRQDSITNDEPIYAAIRPKAVDRSGLQEFEILFWPTPDDEYVLSYQYEVISSRLSEDDPYPLGFETYGQVLLESVLAVAESRRPRAKSDRIHADLFRELLAAAVKRDRSSIGPEFFGYNANKAERRWERWPRNNHHITYNEMHPEAAMASYDRIFTGEIQVTPAGYELQVYIVSTYGTTLRLEWIQGSCQTHIGSSGQTKIRVSTEPIGGTHTTANSILLTMDHDDLFARQTGAVLVDSGTPIYIFCEEAAGHMDLQVSVGVSG